MRPASAGAASAASVGRAAADRPPQLIGGESPASLVKPDWATVTWWVDPDSDAVETARELVHLLIGPVVMVESAGMRGYEHARLFICEVQGTPVTVGRFDFGGHFHGGRCRFEITGAGCSIAGDWPLFVDQLQRLPQYKVTRVDLALDFVAGEFTVEDARDWYSAGEFHAGGRRPDHSMVGDWLEPVRGRSFYVGRRQNGKMLRAYEKGRQLGDPTSRWTRFEVELRNVDRDIPLDVFLDPERYFVGAYRALERLIEAEPEVISTHKAEGLISLGRLVESARVAYGQLFGILRARMPIGDVLDEIARPGIPRRLERASLAWWQSTRGSRRDEGENDEGPCDWL